jgi:hypothetical protein
MRSRLDIVVFSASLNCFRRFLSATRTAGSPPPRKRPEDTGGQTQVPSLSAAVGLMGEEKQSDENGRLYGEKESYDPSTHSPERS